jgi:hypothetical protein
MASNFRRFFKHRRYTLPELLKNCNEIKRKYSESTYIVNKGKVVVNIFLQPSEGSMKYKVKLLAKIGSTKVDVFVVEPNIRDLKKKLSIPHLYPDGSLCLYYPDYNEWSAEDLWADTLIPWTCLWLYFFELWLAIGEWLGGGIHPGKRN